MPSQSIHGNAPPFSASNVVDALSRALCEIKTADRLTFADLGAVLGKSEDSAAHYCDGSATMDSVTFGRGKKEWGSRFTGYFDRLCEANAAGAANDRNCETSVLKAALALSVALGDDGKITDAEIRAHRQDIENAVDALRGLLGRLKVAA
jgi:hypothetical protein